MSIGTVLLIVGYFAFTLVMIVWWLRRHAHGLEWVMLVLPLAFGLSYLSSLLIQVVPYRAGCLGYCEGWRGYPLATHMLAVGGRAVFDAGGFVLNAGVYFLILLVFSAVVLQLAHVFRWSQHRQRWRLLFVLVVIVAPWAYSPNWAPMPQPRLPLAEQRLAINAARDWHWQFRAGRFFERALALEDVRQHSDGQRFRVCFRAYSWFFIPSHHVYIDLEPAGVRATSGGTIPLSASCWVQP
ncbi:MAG: hypothetical protein GXP37_14255 [Chloroflexi bacterium]|nr:hypothetical protein [Chloroflexota bacterium]